MENAQHEVERLEKLLAEARERLRAVQEDAAKMTMCEQAISGVLEKFVNTPDDFYHRSVVADVLVDAWNAYEKRIRDG